MGVCDRLELEGLLLRMMRGKNLVKNDDCAIAITRSKNKTLSVWRPVKC